MFEQQYLEDTVRQLRKLKSLADKAVAQIQPEELFAVLDPEANSIALIMKHVAGNMRSRWTDFLTTDGEKPDRDRDGEFEGPGTPPPDPVAWEDGWPCVCGRSPLSPADLAKTVRDSRRAHTVVEAIKRQVTHYADHVGQIVLLAKHLAGPRWHSFTIPRGKSREFDVAKDGGTYGVTR